MAMHLSIIIFITLLGLKGFNDGVRKFVVGSYNELRISFCVDIPNIIPPSLDFGVCFLPETRWYFDNGLFDS